MNCNKSEEFLVGGAKKKFEIVWIKSSHFRPLKINPKTVLTTPICNINNAYYTKTYIPNCK